MAITSTALDSTRAYVPFTGDYASYGYGPEHLFFSGAQYGGPPLASVPPTGSAVPPPGTGTPGQGNGGGGGGNSGQPVNVPPGTGSGSGTGVGGNEGGASHGVGGGGAGDNAGHPGTNSSGFSSGLAGADSNGTPVEGPSSGYIQMPGWLDAITGAAATLLPMPYSLPFSIGRAGAKAYNMLGVTNPNRDLLGIDDLSALQVLGGMLGSPYGSFQNPEISNAEQTAGKIPAGWGETAITAEGGPVPGWFGFIGGGQPSMSMYKDQPGLPGSSAYDQHQITVAQQQAAAGTLPSFSPQPAGWNFGMSSTGAPAAAPQAYATPTGAPSGPAVTAGAQSAPAAAPASAASSGVAKGMVAPDGTHQIPKDFVGTMQAGQYGYDQSNNFVGGGAFNAPGSTGGISQGSFNINDRSYDAETARDVADSRAAADAGNVGDFHLRRGGRAYAAGGLANCTCGGSENDQPDFDDGTDAGAVDSMGMSYAPQAPDPWDEVRLQGDMDKEDLQRTIANDPGLSGDMATMYRRPAAGTQLGATYPQTGRLAPKAPTHWTPPAVAAAHTVPPPRRQVAAAQPGLTESDRLNLAQVRPHQVASANFSGGGLAGAGIRPLSIRRSLRPRGIAAAGRPPSAPQMHRLLPAGAPNPEPTHSIAAFAPGGFVKSKSAGRADQVKTKVPADTYVMPADVVAALGQGNSLHGAHVLDHTVRRLHARPQLAGGGRLSRNPKPSVDVALSGGEYRIPPSAVKAIGRGSVDAGAGHLDRMVVGLRNRFAQHLHTLPPPRK